MSRLINIPQGKEIKPLLGAYLLKGGRSYEIPAGWHMPQTYTDGTPIDWNYSDSPKADMPSEPKKVIKPKRATKKASKAVKKEDKSTEKAPKVELEDNDVE